MGDRGECVRCCNGDAFKTLAQVRSCGKSLDTANGLVPLCRAPDSDKLMDVGDSKAEVLKCDGGEFR